MQNLLQQTWFRIVSGAILLAFGIGGIIAGFTGQPSNPIRYIIGGLVLTALALNNFRLVQQTRQSSR